MYTTKLTVEIEVVTHFGPKDAIELTALAFSAPCFASVNIASVSTDWADPDAFPSNGNLVALASIPRKVR